MDPDLALPGDTVRETAVAANWFFYGHANKLTLDVSRYTLREADGRRRARAGVRVQWDVSF